MRVGSWNIEGCRYLSRCREATISYCKRPPHTSSKGVTPLAVEFGEVEPPQQADKITSKTYTE